MDVTSTNSGDGVNGAANVEEKSKVTNIRGRAPRGATDNFKVSPRKQQAPIYRGNKDLREQP